MMTISESNSDQVLQIKSATSEEPQTVQRKEVSEPHKTLGVWMSPTGNDTAQFQHLQIESTMIATLIASSCLSKPEAYLAYMTSWVPAMTYSLSTTTMKEEELRSIQSQATAHFLQKMGFNRHFPREVVFGPSIMGGLDLRDLSIEQGISGIMTLMEHLYNQTETGKMIRIALANLQMGGNGNKIRHSLRNHPSYSVHNQLLAKQYSLVSQEESVKAPNCGHLECKSRTGEGRIHHGHFPKHRNFHYL